VARAFATDALLFLAGLACCSGAAIVPPEAGSPPAAPAVRCEVAVVNPVSGFAECVKPRGAPVEAPPPRPAPTPQQWISHPELDLAACRDMGLKPPAADP
jgi:hypothetical protein